MSIYKIDKCDYCGDKNVIVRGTPFVADIPAKMCKVCWDMTKEEYMASNGEFIPKFESDEVDGLNITPWSENDYLLRLIDQTGKDGKFLYKSLTVEQYNELLKILDVKEEDWD